MNRFRTPRPGTESGPLGRPGSSSRAREPRGRLAVVILVLLCAAAPVDAKAKTEAEIRDLEVRSSGDGLRVSFRIAEAFSDEHLERLHSGIPLTFRHRVDLLGKRIGPLMPRKTLGRTVVFTTASYDALTRRYALERQIRPKVWPEPSASVERTDRHDVGSIAEMKAWMTVLQDVPLPGAPAPAPVGMRVRVKSELGRRFILLLFPATTSVSGERSVDF